MIYCGIAEFNLPAIRIEIKIIGGRWLPYALPSAFSGFTSATLSALSGKKFSPLYQPHIQPSRRFPSSTQRQIVRLVIEAHQDRPVESLAQTFDLVPQFNALTTA